MTTMQSLSVGFTMRGSTLSYACGILGNGKSLVFDGDGARYLTTQEMNTTQAV